MTVLGAATVLGTGLLRRAGAALYAAADLVFPRSCGGCGRAATWWCPDCAARLEITPTTHVLADGATACTSVGAYGGPAGAAIVAFKEQGAVALRRPLGAVLAAAIEVALEDLGRTASPAPDLRSGGAVLLVPVPSRRSAVRGRGHDATAGLARAAARRLRQEGHDVRVVRALRHRRAVQDQTGLDAAQRAENLSGALVVRTGRPARRLSGRADVVVVVDDIVTTGASLIEAVRAVRAVRTGQARPDGVSVVGGSGDDGSVDGGEADGAVVTATVARAR